MKGHKRADRVANVIREEVGSLLLSSFHLPELSNVSITTVRVTPDLRNAHIYYTLLDDGDRASAQATLAGIAPQVRKHLGSSMHMKYVPKVAFEFDNTLENARRIEALLQGVRKDGEEEL